MLSKAEFKEELQTLAAQSDARHGYRLLLELLRDLLNTYTEGQTFHFASLFTHLQHVCRHRGINAKDIDVVRRRARAVLRKEEKADAETFAADCRTLMSFATALEVSEGIPRAEASNVLDGNNPQQGTLDGAGCLGLRAVVTEKSGERCLIHTEHGDTWRMEVDEILQPSFRLLREGQTICLHDCMVSDGVLRPNYLIIEPDYLLDISTLAACMAYYGEEPQNYLLRLFEPHETTSALVLGNVANQFVDSIVHAPADRLPEATHAEALMQAFSDAPLDFLALGDAINADFTERQNEQFRHIFAGIQTQFPTPEMGLRRNEILLEPTLLCPSLGLSGRLDIMNESGTTVVELKSGRARESTPLTPQRSHRLQMMLYAEMMRRNFGVKATALRGFLWYSKYPEMLPLRRSYEAVIEALTLRNRIVLMMRFIAEGGMPQLLPTLTPARLNAKQRSDSTFHRLYEPYLERICKPLQQMDDGMREYLCAFSGFLARELWAGKTTDGRAFSTRGFAQTWISDTESKLASGEMIAHLRYMEEGGNAGEESDAASDAIAFSMEEAREGVTPAFRPGDAVILYQRDKDGDTATTRPLYRAFVSEITAEKVAFRLLYPQSARLFRRHDARFAIEHDHMDVGTAGGFGGLWYLAATGQQRRDLLLGRRKPSMREPRPVRIATNPQVDEIVSRALASDDYFLLVGPPGTGKTSVALRALTLNYTADPQRQGGLLLTAYTNRAVDEICAMLEEAAVPYVRIGSVHSCQPAFRPRLLGELVKGRNRRQLKQLLDDVPVVVGTVLTLSRRMSLFRVKRFGLAVIDEASQILEPQLLTLLCAQTADDTPVIPRFIMVGDHKQLPAVVLDTKSERPALDSELYRMGLRDLHSSLFERLHRLVLRDGCQGCTATLTRQGRMHTDIADYASQAFYGGALQPVPLPHQREGLALPEGGDAWERFVAATRMGFVDVPSGGKGGPLATQPLRDKAVKAPADALNNLKANPAEAYAAASLIRAACNLYSRADAAFDPSRQVGVIVPFRAQINLVRQALRNLHVERAEGMTIDTVECYQGSQRDIIVFCTVVSRPWQLGVISAPVEVGGTPVDRKLNVAVTRALRQFFLIGNARILSRSPLYARLISACHAF